ncbi:hypothetical protein [Haloarcula halophila]|uniref:hypothetical protein n=1 Tax=Haloarcula TaxID=2237 RepID=UPI0023E3C305|nr:hypothetical protein [Halomicroarcula sp. DFY41]
MTDELRVHLHFAMRGTYPLRLLDLLFCTETVRYVEYGYLTPFDIAVGSARRRARAFADRVTSEGIATAIDDAEAVETHEYGSIEGVDVYEGGWFGRPKVVVRSADGTATAVRVHGEFDAEAFTAALESTLDTRDVPVRRRAGTGLGRLLGW